MKRLALLVLLAAAGVIGYQHFINVAPASAEARALEDLEQRFEAANQRMMQAGRSAGAAGMDTTADIDAAHAAVLRVQGDLRQLQGRLQDKPLRQRAAALERSIQVFLDRLGD